MPVRAAWIVVIATSVSFGSCSYQEVNDPVVEVPRRVDTEPSQVLEYDPNVPATPSALRKLTRQEYIESAVALFGDGVLVPPTSEPDFITGGLAAVGAGTTTYSPRGVESFEEAAYALAKQAVEDSGIRSRVVTCEPSNETDTECFGQIFRPFMRRAWRRPVTDAEVAKAVSLAGEAATATGLVDMGIQFGLAFTLQSPYYLYRVELGDGEELGDYEIASRLSFFLWNTAPDEQLLDAAEAGALTTYEGLRAHAERMLTDPRARSGFRSFYHDYLQLAELGSLSKDPTIYKAYTSALGPSSAEETLQLLEYLTFDLDADFRALMTTTTTFVDPTLAAIYDIAAPTSTGFARVNLNPTGPRAGLLGHAGFLASHAHPTSTSVTLRGKAVRNILLCQEIPIPPVGVDTSIPEPSGTAPTMRDRVAEHLQDPSCAGCHLLTDPIGLALEKFDSIGRFRETDNGYEIDASGDLDTVEFDNARGLGQAIAAHPAFTKCMARTMMRYALGRLESEAEAESHVDTLDARFEKSGYRLKALALEVVLSPMFRQVGGVER